MTRNETEGTASSYGTLRAMHEGGIPIKRSADECGARDFAIIVAALDELEDAVLALEHYPFVLDGFGGIVDAEGLECARDVMYGELDAARAEGRA